MDNKVNNEFKRWLNLGKISKHLRVSKDTVRAWIRKKAIPKHKVGKQYKFKISEVDAWIGDGESSNVYLNKSIECRGVI